MARSERAKERVDKNRDAINRQQREAYRRKHPNPPRPCQYCGAEFTPRFRNAKFCRKQCCQYFHQERHNAEARTIRNIKSESYGTEVCSGCGTTFEKKRPKQTYCCEACCRKSVMGAYQSWHRRHLEERI